MFGGSGPIFAFRRIKLFLGLIFVLRRKLIWVSQTCLRTFSSGTLSAPRAGPDYRLRLRPSFASVAVPYLCDTKVFCATDPSVLLARVAQRRSADAPRYLTSTCRAFPRVLPSRHKNR